MEQNQRGINKADGKIIWKEERPQRNSWFDKEYLENKKKKLATIWLTEIPDIMNRNIKIRKDAHKICRQKIEYCLNHSLKKWKLLIITMKQEI